MPKIVGLGAPDGTPVQVTTNEGDVFLQSRIPAADVVGVAKGKSYGSAFKFEYDLLIPYKDKKIKVSFDDWIFKQDDEVAINRAIVTKFGFKVGELTVFFLKSLN